MMRFGGVEMMLSMVIFWVLVVGLALWLLGRLFPSTQQHTWNDRASIGDEAAHSSRRALDILDERYARGEISRAEYHEMRRDLEE